MNRLEQRIAEWLERDGRLPDDALTILDQEGIESLEDRTALDRLVDRVASGRPELAGRRRIVLSIQTRIQARGGRLSSEEWKALVERAHTVGWTADDVDRVAQAAIARLQSANPALQNEEGREAAATQAPPSTAAPDSRPGNRRPMIVAGALVGIALLAGAYWLLGGSSDSPTDPQTGSRSEASTRTASPPASPEQIVEAQRLLARLGQPVPESGEFDDATRTAFDRALPQFAGMDELEPWLIEQLQQALAQRDNEAWASARQADTEDAIRAYLGQFPAGAHVSAAYERLDLLAAAADRAQIVLAIQQELNRLGRDAPESGALDAETRAAMVGFTGPMPDRTRVGLAATLEALRALRRWPVVDGGSFRDCLLCPDMIAIPPGQFTMGSPDDERMRSSTEGPQRVVSIERFALSQTEITYGQWLPCVNEGVCANLPIPSEGDLRELPVSHVSATDALLYLRWLRERTGFDYRLPTEAEWEYAARAGTTTRYSTGNCIGDDQANFDARLPTRDCPAGTYRGRPVPVASFPPNAFGLFDMHGNMLEMVQDCWNLDYIGAPTDGRSWDDGDCGRSPLRGGSWTSTDRELRSAARIRPGGIERNPQTGLRIALDLQDSTSGR
jgi:formylglycine-generating enzyme required for sulfatase activity